MFGANRVVKPLPIRHLLQLRGTHMVAADRFSSVTPGADGLAVGFEAITPSDSVELTNVARMIYVGSAGDVTVVSTDGSVGLHKDVPAGTFIGPFKVNKVKVTGTTDGAARVGLLAYY
jgi:hypothetical protein